jgi:hypothetical protein
MLVIGLLGPITTVSLALIAIILGCISNVPSNQTGTSVSPTTIINKTSEIMSNVRVTWEGDIQLTKTNANAALPSMGMSGGTIHVAWIDQREGSGNNEIYYQRSTDGGLTWADHDTRISFNPADSIRPAFAVNGSSVHLFWRDTCDGNYELYERRSIDGGITWTSEMRITQDPGYSEYWPTSSYLL